MWLTNLTDVLRSAGLKVEEVPGWKTRGHGPMDRVESIMCHHTAGPAEGNYPSLRTVRDGRPGLDGPLSQLGLARDGTWLVIAAGRASHAGVVHHRWQENPRSLGIEAEATGTDEWPLVQYDSYARGVSALRAAYGVPLDHVVGHKEAAKPTGRKSDPNFDMDDFRSVVARTRPTREEELSVSDVQRILDYQKACTIQIQENTRQLLGRAVAGITAAVKENAIAVNNFVRQTDQFSDAERRAELAKLEKAFNERITAAVSELESAELTVPEPDPAP